ncbi:MAG: ABC transporter permease [Thermonemataceae bacterium]
MLSFIAKRFFSGFMIIVGVVIVVFFLFFALPGDPVSMMVGQRTDDITREAIRKELGLDQSLPAQLYLYFRDLSPVSIHKDTPQEQQKYDYTSLLCFGESVLVLKVPYLRRSFQTNRKVSEIIGEKLILTVILALAAMFFATIVGISLGVMAALRQNTFWDHFIVTNSVVGISTPSFVAASLVSLFFGYMLGPYLGLNGIGSLFVTGIDGRELHLENLILPAFTLGIRPLAIIVQLTRSSMLEVLSQDYIRTAKAKGLSYYKVIFKHALKNALNPVITAISGWLASLLAGAFFVERIFDYKGLGYETIQAVYNLDLPIVIGATLIVASFFVVVNIIVDLLYALVDPRVRLR